MSNTYKVGSLFAGIGGVCLGFQTGGLSNSDSTYELVWANEMDDMHVKLIELTLNIN